MAYRLIGDPARWSDDMRRGDTWSILPAYTTEGYLPCTGIKKGFFNCDDFLSWVMNELLPHCNPWPQPRSIIVLNNLSVHLDPRVRDAIEVKGCLLRFLFPYSLDYSPIKLTFSLLKTWMRRSFRQLRHHFQCDFGGFLRYAIYTSGCDRFAVEHFRHAAGGYNLRVIIRPFKGGWMSGLSHGRSLNKKPGARPNRWRNGFGGGLHSVGRNGTDGLY